MLFALLAAGATMTNNAIINKIFNATDSSINVSLAHDAFSNNVSVGGTLTVTGTSTLTGVTTVAAALAANGGFSVDSPAFTVANTSGNTVIGGTLSVTGVSAFTGDVTFGGNVRGKVCTATTNDATPSVAGCQILEVVSNSAPLAITDIDNPVVGTVYVLVGTSSTNSPTIADSGNFALSATWTGSVDETLTLYVQADNDYIEVTRSAN